MKNAKTEIVLTVEHAVFVPVKEVKQYVGAAIRTHKKGYRLLDSRRTIKNPKFSFEKTIISQEDAHAILDSLHECYHLIEQNTQGIVCDEKDTARVWLHKYGKEY